MDAIPVPVVIWEHLKTRIRNSTVQVADLLWAIQRADSPSSALNDDEGEV